MERFSNKYESNEAVPPKVLNDAADAIWNHYSPAKIETFHKNIDDVVKEVMDNLSYEEIRKKYKNDLEKAGIELVSIYFSENKEPGALTLQVETIAAKFVEYISENINYSDLEKNNLLGPLLNHFIATIGREIQEYAKFENTSRLTDRMLAIDNLIAEYERIDPEDRFKMRSNADEIKVLSDHYKEKSLREHLVCVENNFYTPPSKWTETTGPWSWHKNNFPEAQFNGLWVDALDALEQLKNVPKLFRMALKTLQEALYYSSRSYAEMTMSKKSDDAPRKYGKIYDDVKLRLKQFDFEE